MCTSLTPSLQISSSEVEFSRWGEREPRATTTNSVHLYPPRFIVRVHGENATMATVATVTFTGTTEGELKTEAVLAVKDRAETCACTAGTKATALN